MTSGKRSAQHVIGRSIRVVRRQASLTLEGLAARAGVSYQYLSGIENGKENFSISVLERISSALGYPLHELIEAAYTADAAMSPPPAARADAQVRGGKLTAD